MNGEAGLRQQAQTFLAQLAQQNDKLIGALLVSPDGLLFAHYLPPSEHIDKIAAMATALHALGKEIGCVLPVGQFRVLHAHFSSGDVYMVGAGAYTLAIVSRTALDSSFLETWTQHAAGQFSGPHP